MGKSTLRSIIDSFDLRAAYDASKKLYEDNIEKDKTSYKCDKAEAIAKILNGNNIFNNEQKKDLAKILSVFTEEEIIIANEDNDSKELHAGVFLKTKEECGRISEDSIIFIETDKDDKDDFVGRFCDDGDLDSNGYINSLREFEHPIFEEVEKFYDSLKDSQKILLISSVCEHQA